MIEVKKNVEYLKSLGTKVDGHGVPCAIKDKVCAGKLGIVVTSERMSTVGLNLNVSISNELVTLKVLEGVAAVTGTLVFVYSTLNNVVEGDLGDVCTGLLAVNRESELGELFSLIAYPRSSLGEVQALGGGAVGMLSNYISGSTVVAIVCLGLIPLLDLVTNDGLEVRVLNVLLSDLVVLEGIIKILRLFGSIGSISAGILGSDTGNDLTAGGVTENHIVESEATAKTVGITEEVCGCDLAGNNSVVDSFTSLILAVDIVVSGNGVVRVHYKSDLNINPTGEAVCINLKGIEGTVVPTNEGNSLSTLTVINGSVESEYLGKRTVNPEVRCKISRVMVEKLNLEGMSSNVHVSVNLEGKEAGSIISCTEAGEVSCLCIGMSCRKPYFSLVRVVRVVNTTYVNKLVVLVAVLLYDNGITVGMSIRFLDETTGKHILIVATVEIVVSGLNVVVSATHRAAVLKLACLGSKNNVVSLKTTNAHATLATYSSLVTGSLAHLMCIVTVAYATVGAYCKSGTSSLATSMTESAALNVTTDGAISVSRTGCLNVSVLAGIELELTVCGEAECNVIKHDTGALSGGVTGEIYTVYRIGKSGKSLAHRVNVLTVYEVVESDLIEFTVKLDSDLDIYPTGEVVCAYGDVSNYCAVICYELGVAIGNRLDKKRFSCDTAFLPTIITLVRNTVNKLEVYRIGGYVSIELEGEVTECVISRLEADLILRFSRNPKLQLTSVALSIDKLIVTVNHSRKCVTVVNFVTVVTGPAVIAAAVEVVNLVKRVRLITNCTVVSKNALNVLVFESMECLLTLGVITTLTGRRSLTGSGSHCVTESLADGLTTASGTNGGLGTGRGCEVVTDDAVTGSVTYKTGSDISTLSGAVIVAERCKNLVICMITCRAYVSHEAFRGTGSRGALCYVGVAESGKYGSLGSKFVTYGTDHTGAVTVSNTSGIHCRNFHLCVSERSDNLLLLGHLVTYRALNACGKTFLGTSGSNTVNGNVVLMTGSGYKIKSAACATCTGVSSITVSYTGRINRGACCPGVHMSIKYPRTGDSIAECDIVNKETATSCLSITGDVYTVDTVGSGGKFSDSIAEISAVNVVVNGDSIGLNVENNTHHNVEPTGELIIGIGNVLFVENKIVPTDSGYNHSALTVVSRRSESEGLVSDTPVGAPSVAACTTVNELHTEVGVHISIDSEGVEAYRTVAGGEVIGRGVILGYPDLKLLRSAGILKLKELIVTLLGDHGILRLFLSGAIAVKSVVNTGHSIITASVKNVSVIKLVGGSTVYARISHNAVGVIVGENVSLLFPLGVTATCTGGGSQAAAFGHLVTESLTFSYVTALTLTHLRIGTCSLCPIVTDSSAAVVESANGANRSVIARSRAVVVTERCDLVALIVLATYVTMVSGIACLGTSGLYNGRSRIVTESGNGSLLGGSNATSGALNTGGKTGLGTSGSNSLKDNVIKMSVSRYLIGNKAVTASSTGMSCITCSITGGLSNNYLVIVAESLPLNGLTGITGLRSGTSGICPIVTRCLAIGKSAASAGAGHRAGGQGHIVAERLTINLVTYSTVLRLCTSSLYKSVRKCLTFSFSTKGTSLSYSTSSICPNVLANFFCCGVVAIAAKHTFNGITRSECKQKDH